MKTLAQAFYLRDTLTVAKDLIGKYMVHTVNGEDLVCRITETEAYTGTADKACHAYGGRHTSRTEALYLPGGHAYVFLIYGMYYCMNIVTEPEGNPCAVLIRGGKAISPLNTFSHLRFQKPYDDLTALQKKNLSNGPGKLAMAMGITKEQNKTNLFGENFFLFEKEEEPPKIETSPRINIGYAEEYVQKPWRFLEKT